MKIAQYARYFVTLSFLLQLLATFLVASLATSHAQPRRVGGPCSYTDHPGKAAIIEVTPIPQPKDAQARHPYQPYRVLFTFEPSRPVSGQLFTPGKAHELTLSGGTPPGPKFLKKYGIKPGATFRTDLHVIASGTCSPVVFTFHGIDVFDFFELKQR
jgi:hypothetical protein